MGADDHILTYRQAGQVKLKCTLCLDRLFPDKVSRKRFEDKWKHFLKDSCNKDVFCCKGNAFTYESEQLIPVKTNGKTPLLLVFGNPASESVNRGMFFASVKDGKELRFWSSILGKAGLLPPFSDYRLSAKALNRRRKKQLWKLDYDGPFRIGLSVFISMPSAASGKWGGVAGIRKLLGTRAFRELENEEARRICGISQNFIKGRGAVVTFQKNAWNALRSAKDPEYSIDAAKRGMLKGMLKGTANTPLYGVPPTRLIGPCRSMLRAFLEP